MIRSAASFAIITALLCGCTVSSTGPALPDPGPSQPSTGSVSNASHDGGADAGCVMVDRFVDVDGDGYGGERAPQCVPPDETNAPAGPGLSKDGGDCDDHDRRAFPDQPLFFETPMADGGFDYDCDHIETPQISAHGHLCQSSCVGLYWWGDVAPACGATGETCAVGCVGKPGVVQGCR